jgi:hypothetical protein
MSEEDPDRHGKADHTHGTEEGHGKPDHEHGQPGEERRYDRQGVKAGTWVNRAVLALVLVALAYIAYALSAAFFPRWWAQRVGDQVGGQLSAGTLWGLFYGFVFTFIPLLVLAQMRRRFFNWTWRFIVLAVAVVLATPNWLTLAVVLGNSNAAHAGERIFDVEAPGFRNATAIGAAAAFVVTLVLVGASMRLARRRREVKELKGRLSERDQEERDRERREHEDERRDGG